MNYYRCIINRKQSLLSDKLKESRFLFKGMHRASTFTRIGWSIGWERKAGWRCYLYAGSFLECIKESLLWHRSLNKSRMHTCSRCCWCPLQIPWNYFYYFLGGCFYQCLTLTDIFWRISLMLWNPPLTVLLFSRETESIEYIYLSVYPAIYIHIYREKVFVRNWLAQL